MGGVTEPIEMFDPVDVLVNDTGRLRGLLRNKPPIERLDPSPEAPYARCENVSFHRIYLNNLSYATSGEHRWKSPT